jgi:CubicO group peptidase (beta-lactamase class C family)
MKKLPRKYRDPLIFLSLLIMVPSAIYFISMNFGDQRVHIEKKQWNPGKAADQGIEKQLLKRAAEYIEARLPMARGMVIIKNGKTVHEKYYWKGGPQERDYLHSINSAILHALMGIAVEKQMVSGPDQSLADFFPDHSQHIGSLTIGDLMQVQAPLIWGEGPPEYWQLFFSGDRIRASLKALLPSGSEVSPAANFAANFLLAEIISKASSMSVFRFADQHLFSPMSITTLEEMIEEGSLMDPFIGFELRTLDLAKFGYLVMNQGMWEGTQVIPRDWVAKIPDLRSGSVSWGGWQPVMIGSTQSIIAQGEGGQYIVLAPELDMIVAVSSKSRFPLTESTGYNHLFGLIFTASDAELTRMAQAVDPEDRPFYEPNFINATVVPNEIRQFFLAFARDIATQDINRILHHYAKGYETKDTNRGFLDKIFLEDETYSSMYAFWRKIFFGGSGDLEFVQIDKLRIDGNRAYMRGNLKYSYANMNEGSFGWFPLENLVKLRGRWLWLGAPEYGEILDRDEYFDAEVSAGLEEFKDDCGQSFVRLPRMSGPACFSEEFLYNGLQQVSLHELLQPLWDGDSKVKMHITRAEESEKAAELEGYLANSLIGTVRLPPGMQVSRQESSWKWTGNGREE